ncbi:MAG: L-serine ammonia-lyase, iron-sulfur-dependent subunit beta [Negativicutes bacterium]|nr:L-serine ammonia-lyase, iron-sulfur-dependent subunit beta [Negativicutes bacterium]
MNISIFDVLGPVMIGPSSSHTAGAARLAFVARQIVDAPFTKVDFYLHGSFAKTYKGHGTDLALVAGVLGLREDDERLSASFELAKEQGISYTFQTIELENAHENTVKMIFHLSKGGESSIIGSSLGGARIIITEVDGFAIEYTATSPAILITQQDSKGIVSSVTAVLAHFNINIGVMKLNRSAKGGIASCMIETDSFIPPEVNAILCNYPQIYRVRIINCR